MREASHYRKLDDNRVLCNLCPHHCRIPDGRHGFCLTRRNEGGILVAANYCRPISTSIDPVEKKPLFHFYPGASIFSSGANGCTFKCSFCQNAEISQFLIDVDEVPLDDFVTVIVESGTIGIAYTYTEPTIWFETIMDVGPRVRQHGLKNVMVTNGYIEPEPLRELLTVVDAMNIDIKSMNPDFYLRICKGTLDAVLRTCELVKKAGCHLEITNLLITDENDDPAETEQLAAFIAGHLGADTPLHISRYFPSYRMRNRQTPQQAIEKAYEIARSRLSYVYTGNMGTGSREDTACPTCETLLIRRSGYAVQIMDELNRPAAPGALPSCGRCGTAIPIVL